MTEIKNILDSLKDIKYHNHDRKIAALEVEFNNSEERIVSLESKDKWVESQRV